MQDTIRSAKGIMQDAWSTLDLAGTIQHTPLQTALVLAARDALKEVVDYLSVDTARPQILVPADEDDRETTEWPAHDDTLSLPSPIHPSDSCILPPSTPTLTPNTPPPPAPAVSPIDGHSVVTGTTARRAATIYNEYMAEILGFLRSLHPFRPHKLNFSEAAGLWNRHKNAGDLPDIVAAAINSARVAAEMADQSTESGQRVVTVSIRERSLSSETSVEEVA